MSRMDKTDYLKLIDDIIATGRYKADWSSLVGHKLPSWYYEGKFGIFIHWGIYSVPAYACEWYPRWMYNPGSREYEYHKKNFGDPSKFGYSLRARSSMLKRGFNCLLKQARSLSCRYANTTTVLQCTRLHLTVGTQRKWALAGMSHWR